jgi:hypothetical protein
MNELVLRLQREAERIASKHPPPEFYTRFKAPHALARKMFFTSPVLVRLRRIAEPVLQEDLGHGLFHTTRVSIDTATLISVEVESHHLSQIKRERLMQLGLISGLLHDICRNEESHAEAGAREAAKILRRFPFGQREVKCICRAIGNHEAFVPPTPCEPPWSQLISDCLYDADKFRWGPDNFTHTLWYMVNHQGITPQELIEKFPWGMAGIFSIADTFRTPTGRQFGPDIIETGIAIGKEIFRYLLQHFKENAHAQ